MLHRFFGSIILVGTAMLALALAGPSTAQPQVGPQLPPALEGALPPFEGASPVWSEDAGAGGKGDPALSPVMALDAGQGANIARIRASLGGAVYQPTIICGSDVNVGGMQNPASSVIPNQTYVGNLTVITGGACPAGQQATK